MEKQLQYISNDKNNPKISKYKMQITCLSSNNTASTKLVTLTTSSAESPTADTLTISLFELDFDFDFDVDVFLEWYMKSRDFAKEDHGVASYTDNIGQQIQFDGIYIIVANNRYRILLCFNVKQ